MSAPAIDRKAALSMDNLTLRAGSTSAISMLLMLLGVVGLVATLGFGFAGGDEEVPSGKIALAAYHAGAVAALGLTLGGLVFTMILHQVGAGWAALVRRQAENVAAFLPLGCLLVGVSLALSLLLPVEYTLFHWMDIAHVASDPIYQHKAIYLNVEFWVVRALAYMAVWIWLSTSLVRMSREQDRTGDPRASVRMRRRSSYGLLLFAFTTAFASFDWLMSMDYHWFSTMFGVYFFAQNMGLVLSVLVLMMLWIRRSGRAGELATVEHLHDLGKLLFGFTAFWGYIGFSQYFLIWYANLPEETSWFIRRKTGDWEILAVLMAVCRFAVPFVVLLPRASKRSPLVLGAMAIWILVFSLYDLLYVVRGEVYGLDKQPVMLGLMDAVAAAAPVLLVLGLLLRRMASLPLAPPHDPRIDKSLNHVNHV